MNFKSKKIKIIVYNLVILISFCLGFALHNPVMRIYHRIEREVKEYHHKKDIVDTTLSSIFNEQQVLGLQDEKIASQNLGKGLKILYFWSPQCGKCKEATVQIQKFERENIQPVTVYGIPIAYEKQEVRDYITQHDVDWIQLWGNIESKANYELFAYFAVPEVWIVDKDNKVKKVLIGTDEINNINYKLP